MRLPTHLRPFSSLILRLFLASPHNIALQADDGSGRPGPIIQRLVRVLRKCTLLSILGNTVDTFIALADGSPAAALQYLSRIRRLLAGQPPRAALFTDVNIITEGVYCHSRLASPKAWQLNSFRRARVRAHQGRYVDLRNHAQTARHRAKPSISWASSYRFSR